MSIISQLKKKDYWEFSGCLMVRASHVARCKKKKKKKPINQAFHALRKTPHQVLHTIQKM